MEDEKRAQLLLAKRQLENICANSKNDCLPLLQLAEINDQLEDLEGVVECCNEALQLNSDMPNVYYNLAFALHRLGKIDEASAGYRNAIGCDPSHIPSYLNLGAIFKAEGDFKNALINFQKVLTISDDPPKALHGCGVCSMELGQHLNAVEYFKKYIVKEQASYQAYCNLGVSLLRLDRFTEANIMFDRALELNPRNGESYFYRQYIKQLTNNNPGQSVDNSNSVLTKAVDDSISQAIGYLGSQESVKLDFPYIYNYLQARFGIKKLFSRDIIQGFIQKRSDSGVNIKDNFALFYRLCDPNFRLGDHLLSRQSTLPIDGTTLQALYCDCWDSFRLTDLLVKIKSDISLGGYDLTHALIAMQWLKENGCVNQDDILMQEQQAVIHCVQLLLTTTEFDDLSIEAVAMLQYSGYHYLIQEQWISAIVSAQSNDGGWYWTEEHEETNTHTSVLALWALLEYSRPHCIGGWVGCSG